MRYLGKTINLEFLYHLIKPSDICIDSRQLKKNDVFFALKGTNVDGNYFANKALKQGAKLAIIDNSSYYNDRDSKKIYVKDTLEILQELAKFHRDKFNIPLIGITGSYGKTTTKELIYTVLSIKYKVHSSIENFNSHIGLPITLFSMPIDTEIGIFEMGARGHGQISELCNLLQPTHGIITNIGEVHLDGFRSIDGVLKGKTELFDYLDEAKGIIFINNEDENLKTISHKYNNKIFYSTQNKDEEIYYHCQLLKKGNKYLAFTDNKENEVETNILGEFNISNVCSALCIAKFFNIDLKKANSAISTFTNKNNRLELLQKKSNLILQDAYNSNYDSLIGAINTLLEFKNKDKILIIGGIKELGNKSEDTHKKIVSFIKKLYFTKVIFCGKEFINLVETSQNILFFLHKIELEEYLEKNKFIDSVILLKASRSYKFETLNEFL